MWLKFLHINWVFKLSSTWIFRVFQKALAHRTASWFSVIYIYHEPCSNLAWPLRGMNEWTTFLYKNVEVVQKDFVMMSSAKKKMWTIPKEMGTYDADGFTQFFLSLIQLLHCMFVTWDNNAIKSSAYINCLILK